MSKTESKIWKIEININESGNKSLELNDAKSILGEYIKVRRNYFDKLFDSLKLSKNYSISKGIESITGNDAKDWTLNPWIFIIAKDKENKAPFWILIKRENDLNGFISAIGPDLFIDYMSSSKENIDELRKLLEYITDYHQKFVINILIPNFLQ